MPSEARGLAVGNIPAVAADATRLIEGAAGSWLLPTPAVLDGRARPPVTVGMERRQ